MSEGERAEGFFSPWEIRRPDWARDAVMELYRLDGVMSVQVNHVTSRVHIVYNPAKVTLRTIKETIERTSEVPPGEEMA